MTEPIKTVPIRLEDARRQPTAEGTAAALYVMVTDDGCDAKVGALEKAANADRRLLQVAKKHSTQTSIPSLEGASMRLAVVAELVGLALGEPGDVFFERWAEVEHLESAMRLVLARRLGRLARWADWIHLDPPIDDAQWVAHVEAAWREVSRLGRDDPDRPS